MKIYSVVMDSWWDCCDTGRDKSETLYAFTTKDLAVDFIIKEIEDLRAELLEEYSDCKGLYDRIKNFTYDVDELKEDCYIDITDLSQHELWGDNNAYRIVEQEVLEKLPND